MTVSPSWYTAAVGLVLSKRLKVSGAGREGGGNGERSETASELLLAVLLSAAAMGAKGDCASARRPHGRDARGQNATRRDVLEPFCLFSSYSTFVRNIAYQPAKPSETLWTQHLHGILFLSLPGALSK